MCNAPVASCTTGGESFQGKTQRRRRGVNIALSEHGPVPRPCKPFFRPGGFYKQDSTRSTTCRSSQEIPVSFLRFPLLITRPWYEDARIGTRLSIFFHLLHSITRPSRSLRSLFGIGSRGLFYSHAAYPTVPDCTALLGTGTGVTKYSTLIGLVAITCFRLTSNLIYTVLNTRFSN